MTARFKTNDWVIKSVGDYGGPGQICGIFESDNGDTRYAVKFRIEGGLGRFIHILTEKQLEPAPRASKEAFMAAVELEIQSCLGWCTTEVIAKHIQRAIDADRRERSEAGDK